MYFYCNAMGSSTEHFYKDDKKNVSLNNNFVKTNKEISAELL